MTHYAELDENQKVINVVYLDNEIITDKDGNEVDQLGVNHLHQHHGSDRKWVRTSYSGNFRNKYAGIGDSYIEHLDAFIRPKPYFSWILNEEKIEWEAPIQKPSEYYNDYEWNEEQQSWFSIKEYIFETYCKNYDNSHIQDAVSAFDLKDNILVPVASTNDYVARMEKVKNFILCHQSYRNWSPSILKEWRLVYIDILKKSNCDLFTTKKVNNEDEREKLKLFVSMATDATFLEEKNNWLIYKRDKYQSN